MMPTASCPVAMVSPSAPGTGPMMGRPSGVAGRTPARPETKAASASRGNDWTAPDTSAAIPSAVTVSSERPSSRVDATRMLPSRRGTTYTAEFRTGERGRKPGCRNRMRCPLTPRTGRSRGPPGTAHRPPTPLHGPAVSTTCPADMPPAVVSMPVIRSPSQRSPVTSTLS